jgi:hypothetical protein
MKQKIAEFFLILQGFRKFLICLLILLVSIGFRIKGLLGGSEFVDIAKNVTLGFFGSNTAEGLFSVVKEHLQARRDAGSVLDTPKEKPEVKDDGDQEVDIAPIGDDK